MGDLYRFRMQLIVYPEGDERKAGGLMCDKTAPCEVLARRLAIEQTICAGMWVDHFGEVRKCNLN